MLTVWCLWWRDPANPDKYSAYHVQRLQRTVGKYLSISHGFVCVTAESVPGVFTMPPPVDYPGWWGKLSIPGMGTERNIFFDLDVVITGNLDFLNDYSTGPLAMPLNWAQSGHGGCQSSVMAWGGRVDLLKDFDEAWIHWPPRQPWKFYGDQEFVTHLRDTNRLVVNELPARYIQSYKYHCRNGLPADCRVTVWHGEPKPESVKEDWFQW